MTEKQRSGLLYVAICGIFWLGALISPSKITYQFFEYDDRHLYNHLFYLFLSGTGLFIGVTKATEWRRRIILSVAAGEISAYLSLLLIVIVRVGIGTDLARHFFGSLLIFLVQSSLFLAPVWPIFITIIYFKAANKMFGHSMAPSIEPES